MPEFVAEKCCCGCTYRTTSILIAVYNIISTIAVLIILFGTRTLTTNDLNLYKSTHHGVIIMYLVLGGILLNMCMNINLFIGSLQRRQVALRIWLIYQIIFLVICFIGAFRAPGTLVYTGFATYLTYLVKCYLTVLKKEADAVNHVEMDNY